MPFALLGLLAVLKRGGNRKSSVGLISGAGLPYLTANSALKRLEHSDHLWLLRTHATGAQSAYVTARIHELIDIWRSRRFYPVHAVITCTSALATS